MEDPPDERIFWRYLTRFLRSLQNPIAPPVPAAQKGQWIRNLPAPANRGAPGRVTLAVAQRIPARRKDGGVRGWLPAPLDTARQRAVPIPVSQPTAGARNCPVSAACGVHGEHALACRLM